MARGSALPDTMSSGVLEKQVISSVLASCVRNLHMKHGLIGICAERPGTAFGHL